MNLEKLLREIDSSVIRESNFAYLERYVNDAKGDFKKYSEVDKRYSPEQGEKQFEVPYKLVSLDSLHVIKGSPDQGLENEVMDCGVAKFFWHPDLPSPFEDKPDGFCAVSPTSSTRTLITRNYIYNFMIKTDLDKRHFRFKRRLKGSSVYHSVRMNQDITNAVQTGSIPFYAYLTESLGLVYGDKNTGTGVVFREINPRPIVNEPRQMIPYFSLYSRDDFFIQDRPILIDLIELNSHYDPLGFFVNIIIGLIQDTWVYFVSSRGILPEMHGQNILLEIDSRGIPKRIIHRDFQSLYSDKDIRNNKKLPQFDKHVIGVEDNITKNQQYSLVFDHFISRYLFERMVNTFVEFYRQYSFSDVARQIRQRFINIPNNILDVFPQTTYRFSKQPMEDNNVSVIDTGEKPIFR